MSNQIATVKTLTQKNFTHPAAIMINGTPGSGKSHMAKNIIESGAIEGEINEIHYFMPKWENLNIAVAPHQSLFVHEGLPDHEWVEKTLKNKPRDTLVVVDDLWHKAVDDKICLDLLYYHRRHSTVSLIFISQSFYAKGQHGIQMRYDFFFNSLINNFKEFH